MKVEQLLSELIQVPSVNPPGNETPVAHYLKDLFSRAGVPGEVLEPQAGRGSFIAPRGGGPPWPPCSPPTHSGRGGGVCGVVGSGGSPSTRKVGQAPERGLPRPPRDHIGMGEEEQALGAFPH